MPDADLERTLPAIMGSAFGAAGQRCLAGSVCVSVGDEARHGELREALTGAAADLVVGDGREPSTDVCPMVSAAAREKVAAAIGRAEADGARLLLDGRGDAGPAGTVLGPTIAVAGDHESELARDELFGPLLTLVEVGTLDEALEFLNGSRYGNAGAIFTRSGGAARAYRASAEAGCSASTSAWPSPGSLLRLKDSIDGDLHANGSDAVDF